MTYPNPNPPIPMITGEAAEHMALAVLSLARAHEAELTAGHHRRADMIRSVTTMARTLSLLHIPGEE